MEFTRKQRIESHLAPHRVLVIYGPRRVGKTTQLKAYLATQAEKRVFYGTGDDIILRKLFASEDRKKILDFAYSYDVIGIDEAQSIQKIGICTKMIVDEFPEKTLILTGSSSFDLSQEIGEPLTGRHFTMTLLPIGLNEMRTSRFELDQHLEDLLVYGTYPEVVLQPDKTQKARILRELVSSYLFKDVLALDKIKSPDTLLDIAKCIAFQVGGEVSLNEISKIVHADVKKVGRYLDLLEKMFVIKRVRGFSRNMRNEISKKAKYYFLDNGVRNAVIDQFGTLDLRNDIGALWENFVFNELQKTDTMRDIESTYYFWRTHTGQEIDIIKETGGTIEAVECKWRDTKVKKPKQWVASYPDATWSVITKENYLDVFLNG